MLILKKALLKMSGCLGLFLVEWTLQQHKESTGSHPLKEEWTNAKLSTLILGTVVNNTR